MRRRMPKFVCEAGAAMRWQPNHVRNALAHTYTHFDQFVWQKWYLFLLFVLVTSFPLCARVFVIFASAPSRTPSHPLTHSATLPTIYLLRFIHFNVSGLHFIINFSFRSLRFVRTSTAWIFFANRPIARLRFPLRMLRLACARLFGSEWDRLCRRMMMECTRAAITIVVHVSTWRSRITVFARPVWEHHWKCARSTKKS